MLQTILKIRFKTFIYKQKTFEKIFQECCHKMDMKGFSRVLPQNGYEGKTCKLLKVLVTGVI
jgi:hypothetical protein